MHSLSEIFGSEVFNEAVMRERLPKSTYRLLRSTIDMGEELHKDVAEVVANAMKDWAIEKGATHYTHWFQPMTDVTAEKHDSFISPTADGRVIMEFSGKELIKGESDASSFPSGGLRATFEARGYTAWDCTSPAFIKDQTLYIPTAFCSYNGNALDKKTPLLRSMEAINRQGLRVLRALGNQVSQKVFPTVGSEQEYFLIDQALFDARKDLVVTGRTLFGALPPKGQEMDDQYYGTLKDRVAAYMHELDVELWKLGVSAKTEHNEAAPAQHELALLYTTANIATDHNQLTMEIMQRLARRHGLACLLHEKPFANVNGSGKHNNWSLATDDGVNLFEPGSMPHENQQFLVFLAAVIWAVDEYAGLIRASAASPGNDYRLGAAEAPPAIISIFLGEVLSHTLEQIASGNVVTACKRDIIRTGTSTLPYLRKDVTDRNRTTPFAFTGNKFEFRMVGSSASIAEANYVLNTVVTETLMRIADRLENAADIEMAVLELLCEVWREHGHIVFNGNGYSQEWRDEARRRGLPDYASSVEAVDRLVDPENVAVFAKHGVLTCEEVVSRREVKLEHYSHVARIEALTMLEMGKREILPAGMAFAASLAEGINAVRAALSVADVSAQCSLLERISLLNAALYRQLETLENHVAAAKDLHDEVLDKAFFYLKTVKPAMLEVRHIADEMEVLCAKDLWPLPTYGDLLFKV